MSTAQHRVWVDESGSDHRSDPGTYVLAAVICGIENEQSIRAQASRLRLPGQVKLHWRDENERRRKLITQTIAGFELEHVVVVRTDAKHERIERRRRKCLERLLFEVEQRGLTDVVLESRGKADDQRDRDMLNKMRGQHHVSTAIRLEHVIGRNEPLLWLPDAICGAITSARTGNDTHQRQLSAQLTLIEI